MRIGVLTLQLSLPVCHSLKEKRSVLKPILHRLHREFNISVSEIDQQDVWKNAVIGISMACNESVLIQQSFAQIIQFIETHYPNVDIIKNEIEII
ncbi:MAG: DUF503 domain-containing protein [Anaerolineaceae bacterium]